MDSDTYLVGMLHLITSQVVLGSPSDPFFQFGNVKNPTGGDGSSGSASVSTWYLQNCGFLQFHSLFMSKKIIKLC